MSPRANFGTIGQQKASPSGKERRKAKQKQAARGKLPNAVVVLEVLTYIRLTDPDGTSQAGSTSVNPLVHQREFQIRSESLMCSRLVAVVAQYRHGPERRRRLAPDPNGAREQSHSPKVHSLLLTHAFC